MAGLVIFSIECIFCNWLVEGWAMGMGMGVGRWVWCFWLVGVVGGWEMGMGMGLDSCMH